MSRHKLGSQSRPSQIPGLKKKVAKRASQGRAEAEAQAAGYSKAESYAIGQAEDKKASWVKPGSKAKIRMTEGTYGAYAPIFERGLIPSEMDSEGNVKGSIERGEIRFQSFGGNDKGEGLTDTGSKGASDMAGVTDYEVGDVSTEEEVAPMGMPEKFADVFFPQVPQDAPAVETLEAYLPLIGLGAAVMILGGALIGRG